MPEHSKTGLSTDKGFWTVLDTQVAGREAVLACGGRSFNARSVQRVLPSRLVAMVTATAREAADSGRNVDRHERNSGRTALRLSGNPITSRDGRPHAVAVWVGRSAEAARSAGPDAGAWTWDIETRKTAWSDSLWELYGATERERTESQHTHEFLNRVDAEDALEFAKLWNDVAVAAPGTLIGLDFGVIDSPDAHRRMHAYGRVTRAADGQRQWRGVSIDVTGFADTPDPGRSLLGAMWPGRAVQSGLVDLTSMRVLRWVHEDLPFIAWPASGDLSEIVHPGDLPIRNFSGPAIRKLPHTTPAKARIRLRLIGGGYTNVQVQAQPVVSETVPSVPAVTIFQPEDR